MREFVKNVLLGLFAIFVLPIIILVIILIFLFGTGTARTLFLIFGIGGEAYGSFIIGFYEVWMVVVTVIVILTFILGTYVESSNKKRAVQYSRDKMRTQTDMAAVMQGKICASCGKEFSKKFQPCSSEKGLDKVYEVCPEYKGKKLCDGCVGTIPYNKWRENQLLKRDTSRAHLSSSSG